MFTDAPEQLALLFQLSVFFVALDLQRTALGLKVLGADLDLGVLFDIVAQLLAQFDLLGQPRQALGVEGVGWIEMLHRGLVEAGQRDSLKLEAVLQQVLGRDLLHLLDEVGALLVQLRHRQLGRDRA